MHIEYLLEQLVAGTSVFPVIERETAERLTCFCLKGGTVLGPLKV